VIRNVCGLFVAFFFLSVAFFLASQLGMLGNAAELHSDSSKACHLCTNSDTVLCRGAAAEWPDGCGGIILLSVSPKKKNIVGFKSDKKVAKAMRGLCVCTGCMFGDVSIGNNETSLQAQP